VRHIRTGIKILTDVVKRRQARYKAWEENVTRVDIAGGRLADRETSGFAVSRCLWRTGRGPGFVRDQGTPGPYERGGGKEKTAPGACATTLAPKSVTFDTYFGPFFKIHWGFITHRYCRGCPAADP
jgi:hypothetical protein